jgi:D-glucosaminate-6-phosphate ammonia-lyase
VAKNIPADLEACRIINAAGPLTRLSGARVTSRVAAAMAEAAQETFDMWALQAAASRRIAAATGAQAGLVTSGASAGLTLAAAAAMAKLDPHRIQALPETLDGANEIIVPRSHRNSYDRALSVAGAKLVDVGMADRETDAGVRGLEAWEVETAIGPKSVAILANMSPTGLRDIAMLAEVAARRGLPLIVDAAAQLPPASNLRKPISMGASLVVFSGGKAIGGPQASGILAGEQSLIASAALQMLDMDVRPQTFSPPDTFFSSDQPAFVPRHGLGRGFKASKEAIVGLMVALDAFIDRNMPEHIVDVRLRLDRLAGRLGNIQGLGVEIVAGRRDGDIPRLAISFQSPHARELAEAVCRHLAQRRPPVRVAEGRIDNGELLVDLIAVDERRDEDLADAMVQSIAYALHGGPVT